MLQQFRYFCIGKYSETSEDIQKSWIMFVGKIMPCLNKNWNDDSTRITSTLSVNTSASDEALAIVAIEKKMKVWLATQNRDTDDDDLLSSQSSPNKKKIRDKWTEDDIENFYEKQVVISRKRKDCETGKDWDLGYHNYLASMLIHSKPSSKKNNDMLQRAFMDDVENSTVASTHDNSIGPKGSVSDIQDEET